MLTQAPRGTKDVLPADAYKWQYVERKFTDICNRFGYEEIRTPGFEHTVLFKRGVGEGTDIVQKEMYTFKDNGKREITLKPEGTSPVVRSFVENKIYALAQPTKVYYNTPCYRYERPQAGRLRAFHQFGVEVFGAQDPSTDAEIIHLAITFFNEVGLNNLELRINSIGCPKCRKEYIKVLKEYYKPKLNELCSTCNDRYEKNPVRIIDCKSPICHEISKGAPSILDYLCDECAEHFEGLKRNLDIMKTPYIIDSNIVRGLDYYSKTAFEIISRDIGAQGTVCGGGRYDGLVEEIGGPSTPGVGFGLGVERLILTLESNNIDIPKPTGLDIFIAAMGQNALEKAIDIVSVLRRLGYKADFDHLKRSLKAQFKYSDKKNASYTLVIGDNELEKGNAILKNMQTGEQSEISIDNTSEKIANKLIEGM